MKLSLNKKVIKEPHRRAFKSLYAYSIRWSKAVNSGQEPQKKRWKLPHGTIEALLWNNTAIPKTGLSFLANNETYRVGLNIYVYNPLIPDGSFAVLLAQQGDAGFIGGVLELFPAVGIEDDIAGFRTGLDEISQNHRMDSNPLRQGLRGAFRGGENGANLGAEAGFNFYRAGLEATAENLLFAHEAFIKALEEYKVIVDRRKDGVRSTSLNEKELSWQRHLRFMKEEDIGIKMALEQGLPMDFFEFSTFPPVQ